jgi:hypothetical protein
MSFLRNRGYTGMKLRNLKAPFNDNMLSMIKNRQFFYNDDRNEVGLTIQMVGGELLEIYAVFI